MDCTNSTKTVLFLPIILEIDILKEELPPKRSELELDAIRPPKVKEHEELERKMEEYRKNGGKVTVYAPQHKRNSLYW